VNLKKPGAKVIFALFVLCLSLDIFTVFGLQIAPDAVGHTMCILRPLDFFARFLFPSGWSQYVDDVCTGFPNDTAISLIAFLLKVSLVSLGLIAVIAMLPLREKTEGPSLFAKKTSRPDKPARWGPVFILFILPAPFVWRSLARTSPGNFQSSIPWKAHEDMLLFAFFVSGVLAWLAFADLVLLPVLRRCFPEKNWIRTR
jgi:hypothetical protein